jgi:hypothetical protein
MTDKGRELADEFRTVFAGRSSLIDSIIAPVVFVIVNAVWGFEPAVWASLAVAGLITTIRLARRQPLGYALGGLGGVVLAILVARFLGRAEGYFLPNILTGGLTVVLAIVSVLIKRPLVAWTSYIYRRWPLEWYWHPQVRPAYAEVTWLWALFFALRLLAQLFLFQGESSGFVAIINVILGWPATIVLLIASYLYGTWRLRNLGGPSVEELKSGAEPPWEGQQKGF